MKNIFKHLFWVLVAFVGLKGFAQCPAPSFGYSNGTGGSVTFSNYINSYDSISPPLFIWNFGDGDTLHSSNYSVNHTYTTPGSYSVSLEAIVTALGCDSTVSETIHVSLCAGAAQYSTTQIGFGDYAFAAANQSLFAGATYLWNFGDGTSSTLASPTHQFSANGAYAVTLTVTDASLSCIDTSYQDGMPGSMAVTLCDYPVVIADTIVSYNPVVVNFQGVPGNQNYTYAWSFGDGGTGTGTNLSHSYYETGAEGINLTVSDAATGCTTTAAVSYYYNLCGFTANIQDDALVSGNTLLRTFIANIVYDTLSGTPGIASYAWTFQNATPSTGTGSQVNNVLFPAQGTNSACVYVTTTSGCIDTVCQGVSFTVPTSSISGYAGKANGSNFTGSVYLIQDSAGYLSLIDSIAVSADSADGFYNFGNVPLYYYTTQGVTTVDTYYVKAALSAADADYANYLPTYYNNVLSWTNASLITLLNGAAGDINISLIEGTNPGGPGFVGGYVSQGAGLVIGNAGNGNAKALGEPLAGLQVNLLTAGNQAVAYTYTDANGHYQFANLALGSYKIYVEQLNKVPNPLDFTLTAENPVDSGANMSVNSHSTTGIDNVDNLQILEVYPNPVVTSVQVQIGCKQAASATLKLTDILGRTSIEEEVALTSGQNTAEVNMESVAAGVYMLHIQTGGQQVTYKIVKAK